MGGLLILLTSLCCRLPCIDVSLDSELHQRVVPDLDQRRLPLLFLFIVRMMLLVGSSLSLQLITHPCQQVVTESTSLLRDRHLFFPFDFLVHEASDGSLFLLFDWLLLGLLFLYDVRPVDYLPHVIVPIELELFGLLSLICVNVAFLDQRVVSF